jgi:hypothetical protein
MAVSARARVCARAVPMHASRRGWDACAWRTEGGSGRCVRRFAAGGCAMHGTEGAIEPKSITVHQCAGGWCCTRACAEGWSANTSWVFRSRMRRPSRHPHTSTHATTRADTHGMPLQHATSVGGSVGYSGRRVDRTADQACDENKRGRGRG